MIRNSGRRPVIDPRKDHALKGYNLGAEMLRWRKENPEEFERTTTGAAWWSQCSRRSRPDLAP